MRTAIIVVVAFVAACSGYSDFYKPAADTTPELIAKMRAAPPPSKPALLHSSGNPNDIAAVYVKLGYAVIGSSDFNSANPQSEFNAVDQGKKVGADLVVVISPKVASSSTALMPMTVPTTSTSYTTGTTNNFASGGSEITGYSGLTTTHGTKTTYIPYTVHSFNFGALYFVKRHVVLGVNTRALTDQERTALGSNKGVYVYSLVEGSPAFREDVLPGDVIVSINGEPVYAEGFTDLIYKNAGRKVDMSIARIGATLTKSIQLNP